MNTNCSDSEIASDLRVCDVVVQTPPLAVKDNPQQSYHRGRNCKNVPRRTPQCALWGYWFRCTRIYNLRVRKHHAESPAAQALRQREVEKCDQGDDHNRSRASLIERERAVIKPDQSEEGR